MGYRRIVLLGLGAAAAAAALVANGAFSFLRAEQARLARGAPPRGSASPAEARGTARAPSGGTSHIARIPAELSSDDLGFRVAALLGPGR